MKILICDDMADAAYALERILQELGLNIKTAVFNSGTDALRHIRQGANIDVCFLDIMMPEMNGIELAQLLRQNGYRGSIVFLSSSSEYGPETYEVNAFTYMLKPPTPEKVKSVLEKIAAANMNIDTAHILLKTEGCIKNILLRDISHAEVIGHYVYYRLVNGSEIEVTTTFKEASLELLSSGRFAQCHRSYVVNMEDIAEITNREIIMHRGKKIPISKTYAGIKSIYFNWKIKGEGI